MFLTNGKVPPKQTREPLKASNVVRMDPTRTNDLRKKMAAEFKRRFTSLRREISELLLIEDALGLRPLSHDIEVANIFCATGPGGGIDPSCGSGDTKSVAKEAFVTKNELTFSVKLKTYEGSDKVSSGRVVLKSRSGKELGHARFDREGGAARHAEHFPGVEKAALAQGVFRIAGIEVNPRVAGRGLGGELYLRAMAAAPGDRPYFYNSQASHSARASLTELRRRGFIEYHEHGSDSQRHFKRITPAGLAYLRQVDASRAKAVANVFCPTGKGGGVKATCSPVGKGVKPNPTAKERVDEIAKTLSPHARKAISSELKGIEVFDTPKALRDALKKKYPGEGVRPRHTLASYNRRDGMLYLTKKADNSVLAHELGHVINGGFESHSSNNVFVNAWRREASAVSPYARTHPAEGMAELYRLRHEHGREHVERIAPRMTRALGVYWHTVPTGHQTPTTNAKVQEVESSLPPSPTVNKRWSGENVGEQMKSFQLWLEEVIDRHLYDTEWWLPFADDAYTRGVGRAYDDVNKRGIQFSKEQKVTFDLTKAAFLRSLMFKQVKSTKGAAFTTNVFCPTGKGGGVDPTCGAGESGGGNVSSVDDLRHHLTPDADGRLGTKAIGKVTVKAYRVGNTEDKHGRGIYLSGDREGAQQYASLHAGQQIREYTVRFQNALLAGHQNDVSRAFFGRSYQEMQTKLGGGVTGGRRFDVNVAKEAKKRGYDGIIYLKPAPPARTEVVVLRQRLSEVTTNAYRGAGGRFVTERVHLLALRIETEMRGITTVMAQKMARDLADGLARGATAEDIARTIDESVVTIGINRAMSLVETEITRDHAEGQLDAMEELDIEEVSASVEWATTDAPCDLCAPLDGIVLKISEARGMIPRHVRCKCGWLPLPKPNPQQIKTAKGIRAAIRESVEEGGEDWVGADTQIASRRPVRNEEPSEAPDIYALTVLDQFLRESK